MHTHRVFAIGDERRGPRRRASCSALADGARVLDAVHRAAGGRMGMGMGHEPLNRLLQGRHEGRGRAKPEVRVWGRARDGNDMWEMSVFSGRVAPSVVFGRVALQYKL